MATVADKNLLFKIAKAYYEDNLTQGEIGNRFGLSRIKVSRLLQQARDERVVQITIIPPQNSNAELERELEVLYGLNEVVVISPTSYDALVLMRELGAATADCLQRCLQGHEVVGFSWGSTLLSVVDHLSPQNWPDMKIVQVIGGLGRPEAEVHGTDLTRRTAQIFGAKPRMLASPGIVPNKLVRDALLTDPQISDTLQLAAKADVLLLGIGRPTPGSAVMQSGILTTQELQELEALGAVGDIALRFFDSQGRAVNHEINDRIIGLDLAQIKKAPRIIGAAGGEQKYEVIRAALAGGLINVLITDERTALKLKAEKEEVAAASVN